ncbi:hypothetical protein TNCT_99681 [Trichonephila clavata]|uniref:Uncharacterized protein n=1 Tax=Trichonephila clavata TaxID=2740835 RepID=A0A8X6H6G5_TRICU|nr:hypothetical protein TNCT_99681 [Trichonephila clavata]
MNEHLPVCVALQETLLKPSCTSNKRGYSILQKDCNTGERACGRVALLINHATPFSPVLIRNVASSCCSADLTWSVLGNPLGSDHFPVVISYATPIECATLRQPRWKFNQAGWETFRTQADITEDMVRSGSIDEAGYYLGNGKDPCGEGYAAEKVAYVTGDGFEVRSAESVPEVEGLGSGWLGGGNSFISRNPPWLRPWKVHGSTLWGFTRCLALKNPPAVPHGTLEKCGNSGSGSGVPYGAGRNPCWQIMMRTKGNIVLPPPMERYQYILFFLASSTTLSWADRVKNSTPSSSPGFSLCPDEGQTPSIPPVVEQKMNSNLKPNFSSNTQQKEFSNSARFFIIKTPNTFSAVSPFLFEKVITSSIGQVKTICKMRSGVLVPRSDIGETVYRPYESP